jgi:hypothetical protein
MQCSAGAPALAEVPDFEGGVGCGGEEEPSRRVERDLVHRVSVRRVVLQQLHPAPRHARGRPAVSQRRQPGAAGGGGRQAAGFGRRQAAARASEALARDAPSAGRVRADVPQLDRAVGRAARDGSSVGVELARADHRGVVVERVDAVVRSRVPPAAGWSARAAPSAVRGVRGGRDAAAAARRRRRDNLEAGLRLGGGCAAAWRRGASAALTS